MKPFFSSFGMHPSANNQMIGRLFDPQAADIPKSFSKDLKRNKISDMFLRLWRGHGVPGHVCTGYANFVCKPDHLKHVLAVGVADPIYQLPAGSIFLTGFHHILRERTNKKIFVTRSPCLETRDGAGGY